jgi:hypothetical protein
MLPNTLFSNALNWSVSLNDRHKSHFICISLSYRMGTQQFQKRAVANTEMRTHKRKNYQGSKIQKPSSLSPEVLHVNPGINTIFQKYGNRLKIPEAKRERRSLGGFTNIKRHVTKFSRPEYVHPCINHTLPVSNLLILEIRSVCTVTVDHVQWLCFGTRCWRFGG